METSWTLKRSEIDEDFVRLGLIETSEMPLTRNYLERQVLREKCKQELNIDNYVVNMRQYSKQVQFYMYTRSRAEVTYLTGPHFTQGLRSVAANTEHVIKNLAHYVPLFVFLCSEDKRLKYDKDVDLNKALVNKTWILEDFEEKTIQPEMILRVPPNSVYFLYTVSHSSFAVTVHDQGPLGTPSTLDEHTKEIEESSEGQQRKMDERIKYLAAENDDLKIANRQLRLKNRALEATVSTLKKNLVSHGDESVRKKRIKLDDSQKVKELRLSKNSKKIRKKSGSAFENTCILL